MGRAAHTRRLPLAPLLIICSSVIEVSTISGSTGERAFSAELGASERARVALPRLKVMFVGTYDSSKPRNRILLRGLREAGAEVLECHEAVWETVVDKSKLSPRDVARHLWRVIRSYARLGRCLLISKEPDVVWIGYLGQLDVLVLGLLARARGIPVVWDVFISLYDTVVNDRSLVPKRGFAAVSLYALEWLGCRMANLALMDTQAHADYLASTYRMARHRVDFVWVGVEPEAFAPVPPEHNITPARPLQVLFYGQFIALHGIDTIIRAARMLEGEPIFFSMIGTGQEAANIRSLLAEQPLSNLKWEAWVPYEDLATRIAGADVCLGIFGKSGKASRVIPNKVFQVVSVGRPLVTRDSDAIRELLGPRPVGVWLVPPADPAALAERLRALAADRLSLPRASHAALAPVIAPRAIGERAISLIRRLTPAVRRGES